MKLNEVLGDTSDNVILRLERIKSVIRMYKNFINPPSEITEAFDLQIQALYEDRQNLHFWVSSNPRIDELYREIQELLRL